MEPSIPLLEEYSDSPVEHHEESQFDHEPKPILSQPPPPPPRWTTGKPYRLLTTSLLIAALPRFLRPGGLARKSDKIHSTAYLDALRGYAACIVFAGHLLGYPAAIQYPFLRVLTSNRGMVDVFFVISGYVLSYRMLKLMRQKNADLLLQSLASSTFRRYLRLYVPTGIATFIAMLLVYTGHIPSAPKLATFKLQLWDWIVDTIFASSPFADLRGWWYGDVFRTKYLDQMWTIPVEFRGSIILFAFCAASCKLSVKGRMVLTWLAILACYIWNVVYVALFLLGMFVAELSLERDQEAHQPRLPAWEGFSAAGKRLIRSVGLNTACIVIFIISLFLLSQPHDPGFGSNGPFPWQYLTKLTPSWYSGPGEPKEHFWLGIGAFLLVLSLEFYPKLQTPLRWNFSLYLGELSFGLYAVHPMVIWALYINKLTPYRQIYLGESTLAYFPGVIITSVVSLWAADYFERVDRRVVQFGRWLQNSTFEKWQAR
ncbi:hypothetical protein LTR84_007091 [Exophiala bonariae]|uniref:Acyltransferase 3 domain-containing protein n=1 Tax=Exophiala bonariae TaxID=1690606 RepID=A0AAV9MZL5_9EURO|nr:hypothetical protein LTR84_007091 [Exophiala bonariae]